MIDGAGFHNGLNMKSVQTKRPKKTGVIRARQSYEKSDQLVFMASIRVSSANMNNK